MGSPLRTFLTACGAQRLVSTADVDVGQTCNYDTTGALVAASTCSKPIGGCNCFYAGEIDPNACKGVVSVDACDVDAGSN
jgi:hypothetical protein